MKEIIVYSFSHYTYDPKYDDRQDQVGEIEKNVYRTDSPIYKNFVEPYLEGWKYHFGITCDEDIFHTVSLETAERTRNKLLKKISNTNP